MSSDAWWELDGDGLAEAAVRHWLGLARSPMHQTWLARVRMCRAVYESRDTDLRRDQLAVIRRNVVRNAANAAQSKIAARARVKPTFVTNDGDYRAVRRAKKMGKVIDSVHMRRHGRYRDLHQLNCQLALDAMVDGTGVAKCLTLPTSGRVLWERTPIDMLLVDPYEPIHTDYPRTLIHHQRYDRTALCSMYDLNKADKESVMNAPPARNDSYIGGLVADDLEQSMRLSSLVDVIELWRRKDPESDEPGRHAVVVQDRVLVDEQWDYDDYPFVFLHWTPSNHRFWGVGLLEEQLETQLELGRFSASIQEQMVRGSTAKVFYDDGSVDPDLLKKIDSLQLIPMSPGATRPPTIVPSVPLSSVHFSYLQMLAQGIYETSGINELSATGQKPAGLSSGKALLTMNDIQSERFLMFATEVEQLVVDEARQTLRAVQALDGLVVDGVKVSDVVLPDGSYEIQVFPISSLGSTPQGRLEIVEQLRAGQYIDTEQAIRLLNFPDLERETARMQATHDAVELHIDQLLDTPEDAEETDWRPPGPDPAFDLVVALKLVVDTYVRAVADDAPVYVLQRLVKYREACQTLVERASPPAPAAPPGPPGEMMPPGMPPPGMPEMM